MATVVPPAAATPPASQPAAVEPEKVDYLNLPCPIPYEEIHREALMSLKPELFEGLRFDFTKGLNQKFSLSHSVFMGPTEFPAQSNEPIKIPTAHYEFGANFIDPKLMLFGRVLTDGRVNARVKCDLSENLTLKANAQLANEPHMSHVMANFDYKGKDYRTQFQLGNGALFGANYIQNVTPNLSLGGEVFWAGQHRKSGIGYAARYNTDKMVATGQVASTGMVALSYVQKVSEKVSLAADYMYNYMSKDATASFGYDYILRQCRLRGKIDSNGCVAAFMEERLNMGLNFILSAEVKMLGGIQKVLSHGIVLKSAVLQHIRLVNPVMRPLLFPRYESVAPARMEEHGFESTTIADVLKAKGKNADGSWLWCTTDDTVYDAVKSMTQHNVGALVVVKPGEQRSIAGIITERDYLRKIIVQGRSSKSTKVGDIMTEENKLVTVKPDTKVLKAMQLMTDNRIRHIPVIDDAGMIGMVSIGDVVRAVVSEHREELDRLNAYIHGGY